MFNTKKKKAHESRAVLLYQEQKWDSSRQNMNPVKTVLFSWKRESRTEKELVVSEIMIFWWQQKQTKQTHFLKMKMELNQKLQ